MRVAENSAAGFIAGTVPTKGICGHFARRCGKTSVEAVLQAITTQSGFSAPISVSIAAITSATTSASGRAP